MDESTGVASHQHHAAAAAAAHGPAESSGAERPGTSGGTRPSSAAAAAAQQRAGGAAKRPRVPSSDDTKAAGTPNQAQQGVRVPSDLDLEEEVAAAVGLNPWGLNEHEHGLLADDLEEEFYFLVRNHILALWRADVGRYLSESEAASRIIPRHRHLVSAAWSYLDREGYINWGVAPAITNQPGSSNRSETVVVIGAGLAGLSAARQLRNKGYRVLVVEGADRPGGRVYTHRLEGADGTAAVADLGGSIITGIDGNPLAVLARQLDIPMHDIVDIDVPLYLRDGSQLDAAIDQQAFNAFNSMLDRSAELKDQMAPAAAISLQAALDGLWERTKNALGQHMPQEQQKQAKQKQPKNKQQQQKQQQTLASACSPDEARELLIQWHMANVEFSNATRLCDISMKHWDLDDPYEHQGAHVFLPGGNLRLLQALAQDVPILYKAPARLLQYCATGVRVHTDAGVLVADAALVTVPLGVLKRRDGLQFSPPLPARKQAAIQRLGFGCLNKVTLLFPHCFWGGKDMFGHVNTDASQRGLYFLFYAAHGISGGAVLTALVAGDAAVALESRSQDAAVADVMQLLRSIFGPQGVDVPDPMETVMTKWGCDPMSYGSYSSVAVGSTGAADYEALAKPLGNRVFFAGEATTSRHPATMHGAFATGLREAANIMAALAAEKGAPVRPRFARGVPEVDDAAAAKGQQPLKIFELLQEVLGGGCEPDLEFGGFKAYFGPQGSHLEDQALVALSLDGLRNKPKKPTTTMYLALPLAELQWLQELPSDDARVSALVTDLGVKLAGRPLSPTVLQLLGAIAQDRQRRGLFTGQLPESHMLTVAPPAPPVREAGQGVMQGREGGSKGDEGSDSSDGEAAAYSQDTSADDEDYIAFV